MKRLIVNADDFGLTRGITDGILEAHRTGIVTRASLMPSARDFDYAASGARHTPALSIGVHLTLVWERPVLDKACLPSLAPQGHFPRSYGELLLGLASGRIKRSEVERELHAQVEKCLKAGLRPTHLDSHQHVHMWPTLLSVVMDIASAYQIPYVRLPLDSPRGLGAKSVLCVLARFAVRKLRSQDLLFCERTAGLFESGNLTEARLLHIVDGLREGTTELVCHPGRVDRHSRDQYGH